MIIYICTTNRIEKERIYKIGQVKDQKSLTSRLSSLDMSSIEDIVLKKTFESECSDKYIHSILVKSNKYKKVKGEWYRVSSFKSLIEDIEVIIRNFKKKEQKPSLTKEFLIQDITEKMFEIIRDDNTYFVLLEKDLSNYYQADVSKINQAKKRNEEKFLNRCFKLTTEEYALLVQNRPDALNKRVGYFPSVYTKEGVAILSSVIKSKQSALMFSVLLNLVDSPKEEKKDEQ